MTGRGPLILPSEWSEARGGSCGAGEERSVVTSARPRDRSGVGTGVLSFESRVVESGRPVDRDMLRGRPHDVRRSALGLGGGLVCKGHQNLVTCSIERGS